MEGKEKQWVDLRSAKEMAKLLAVENNAGYFKKMTNIQSSFWIGLFWFSSDYSAIEKKVADKEIEVSEVRTKLKIIPDGSHAEYRVNPYSLPRGRIQVEVGNIVIYVGESCPNSAINLVIEEYGISKHQAYVRIKHDKFWDVNRGRNAV
jgi:hypothetical protein